MTTETTTSPIKAVQSRGDLAHAFPNTDWASAFAWLPRFNAVGGWIDQNGIGRQILGQAPAQQIDAEAVQDEWQDIFCGSDALVALARYDGQLVTDLDVVR